VAVLRVAVLPVVVLPVVVLRVVVLPAVVPVPVALLAQAVLRLLAPLVLLLLCGTCERRFLELLLLAGLERGMDESLTPAERRALPWLMIEACALESIVPIARTGRFSQLRADAFLPFIRRKLEWIESSADAIARLGA
jgi:hypothetical protein